jgi:serine/threonine protein kinase
MGPQSFSAGASSVSISPVLAIVMGVLALVVVAVLLVPLIRFAGWIVGQVVRFITAEIADLFRLVGLLITMVALAPLALVNVLLGRWSAAEHFGRSSAAEGRAVLSCLYRLLIGHPVRLVGGAPALEGLEQRLPRAVAEAPPPTGRIDPEPAPGAAAMAAETARANIPRRVAQFAGYSILGTLPGGGSGSRLFIARPDAAKLAAFQRQGFGSVGDVVIKSFSTSGPGGSTLPQIVRENRALEAAKKLGLVLEHELTNDRFYYVMRYVPGDSLGLVAQRLHAMSGDGLKDRTLAEAVGYVCDLVGTLADYHKAGLWHKDVKPDNIIVANGHAHLVDFGLVTPLRSSMTLTTHGTEYFRDPEMVRMALKGAKVHEVDGAKFDLYAAGAVLFSVIENSFPAHGGLSQITRPCPEAVRWVVRRAMTDYDKRYPSAMAMLADLREIHRAAGEGRLDAMRPADLPSVREGDAVQPPPIAPIPALANHTPPPPVGRFQRPGAAADLPGAPQAGPARQTPGLPRRSAADQLQSARSRSAEMRRRAQARMGRSSQAVSGVGKGTAWAVFVCVVSVALLGTLISNSGSGSGANEVANVDDGQPDDSNIGPVVVMIDNESIVPAPAQPPETPTTRSGRKKVEPPAPVTIRAGVGEGTAVLVLQEPGALSPEAIDHSRGVLRRMKDAGFALVGSAALLDRPEAEDAPARELEAALRREVGLKVIPGTDARSAVNRWLAARADVGAVLWIARDGDRDQMPVHWLITAERLGTEQRAALGAILSSRAG